MDHITQQANWNDVGAYLFDLLHQNASDAQKCAAVLAEMEQWVPITVPSNPRVEKAAAWVFDRVAKRLTPAQKTQILQQRFWRSAKTNRI